MAGRWTVWTVQELTGAQAVHDKAEQTLFQTADVELGETMDIVFLKPSSGFSRIGSSSIP